MGKSQDGAIWLDKDLVSSYQFWQFWRNTSDADVGRFLKLYTELPLAECNKLESLRGAEINEAKITLANEVTKLLHGETASLTAQKTSRDVFERGGSGDQLPTLELALEEASGGISIVQLIVRTGLASSGKEAKRLISESGAKMNDKVISNHAIVITHEDLLEDIKLSAGKKRHALVKLMN